MLSAFDSVNKIWSGGHQPSVLNPEANVGQLILNVLERNPEKIAQICADTGSTMTFNEMRLRSIRVAQNLTSMGYKKGDLLCIVSGNVENLTPIIFGCFLIGAPFLTLAPKFDKDDMAHMLKLVKPILIFCEDFNRNVVKDACVLCAIDPKIEVIRDGMDVLKETGKEMMFYPKFLGDSNKLMAAILCSSGTTGLPKGVCLQHAILVPSNNMVVNLNFADVTFNYSSIYWSSALCNLISTTLNGGTRVVTTQDFDPDLTFEFIEKYKINMMFMPPLYVSEMLKSPKAKTTDLSSLKMWCVGGSIVPEVIKQQMNSLLKNGRSGNGYGMTEMGFIAFEFYGQKPNSVGNLVTNMKGKIIDEEGNTLNNGEKGELCLKFVTNFMGYYKNEKAYNETVDSEGWFHTGDIAYFDDEGYLFLVDRLKDIMKYKGMQVSPSDIESVILQVEGVKQVCVVGIPNEDQTTDLITAVVVKDEGFNVDEDTIIKHVEKSVADFKKLRGGVYFIEKLPMTLSGKILRRKAREYVLNNLKI